jgi:hypothetical protein
MMGMGSEVVASGVHINQLHLGKQKLDGCGVRQNQVGLTQPIPNNIGLRGYASQWKETKTYHKNWRWNENTKSKEQFSSTNGDITKTTEHHSSTRRVFKEPGTHSKLQKDRKVDLPPKLKLI